MNPKLDAEIFREDRMESNSERVVIFISPELVSFLEKWGKKHGVQTRSACVRFIIRCCKHHEGTCNNK